MTWSRLNRVKQQKGNVFFLGDGMFLTGENAAKSLQQRHKHQECRAVWEWRKRRRQTLVSHDASMDRTVFADVWLTGQEAPRHFSECQIRTGKSKCELQIDPYCFFLHCQRNIKRIPLCCW